MTSQSGVKMDQGALAQAAKAAQDGKRPPVHLWNPPFCGDLDMVIRKDGSWYHEGGKINRPEMVRLFALILRKEGASYYLVTPVEKVGITVEDAPFVAVDISASKAGDDQQISFETNVGDRVTAGPDTPIRVELSGAEPAPYVMVRDGLEARIDRKSFYRLIDLGETAEQDGEAWFGVRSAGEFFALIPAAQLED